MLKNGTSYAYFDSDMLDAGVTTFKLSSMSIADVDSSPGHTLNQVYNPVRQDQAHVFYNDEDADGNWFVIILVEFLIGVNLSQVIYYCRCIECYIIF